jgi:hypothetical protein
VEIFFNDFVESFFKSWQISFFKKIIEFFCNKNKTSKIFGRVKNLHQKNGWSPLLSDYIIGSSTSCLIIFFHNWVVLVWPVPHLAFFLGDSLFKTKLIREMEITHLPSHSFCTPIILV